MQEEEHKLSGNMGCSCLCEDAYDIHYRVSLSEKYSWYRICGNKFLVDVVRNEHFKGKRGGIVYWFAQDGVDVSLAARRRLYELGQPIVAHDLRLPITSDIVFMPDYHYISYDGYRDLKNVMDTYNARHPFESKHPQVFWRGAPNAHRLQLVNESLKFPWMNLGLASAKGGQNITELILTSNGLYREHTVESEWIKYRGIMDMDGHANAWGLYWRIASGSVVFKLESNWTNGYIRNLVDGENVFLIKKDLSNLKELTAIVRANDSESIAKMKNISHNARMLAKKYSYANEVSRVAKELTKIFDFHHISLQLKNTSTSSGEAVSRG